MIKALMFMPLLLGGVSAPALVNETPSVEVSESVNAQMPNKKSASYNDLDHEITLTLEEVTYAYDNFAQVILDYRVAEGNYNCLSDIGYNGSTYDFSEDDGEWLIFAPSVGSTEIYFEYNGNQVLTWHLRDTQNDELLDFEYGINLTFNTEVNYLEAKEAIEADIDANSGMPTIQDIFTTVTQAVTSFVGSLGQAFNSVTALFYANGAWTFLGILVLIAVGVGLIYLAYRVIKGLLHRV